MKFFRVLSLTGVILVPLHIQADPVSAGGVRIDLPAPEGYVRVDGIDVERDESMRSSIPSTNRMLADFGTREEREAIQLQKEFEPKRSFNVQAIEPGKDFTAAQFSEAMMRTARDLAENLKRLESDIQRRAKEGGQVPEVGRVESLGTLGKGRNWLTYGIRMKVKRGAQGKEVDSELFAVSSMVNLGSKIVMISGKDFSAEPGALDSLTVAVNDWQRSIFAANPELATNTFSGGGFNWGSVGEKALIWGAIGGAIGLLFAVFRTKKKPA